MAHFSVPLFGLTHEVTIVRHTDADDGFGGIIPSNRNVVYSEYACRLTTLELSDHAEVAFAGPSAKNMYKMTGEPVANLDKNDFVELPFGQFPNVVGVLGEGEYFPLEFAAGAVDMFWDYDLGYYVDDSDTPTNTFQYSSPSWDFAGTLGSNSFLLDRDCSPFAVWDRWSGGPTLGTLGPIQTFRIIWVKPQIDVVGNHHHTMCFIELEDVHGDDGEAA